MIIRFSLVLAHVVAPALARAASQSVSAPLPAIDASFVTSLMPPLAPRAADVVDLSALVPLALQMRLLTARLAAGEELTRKDRRRILNIMERAYQKTRAPLMRIGAVEVEHIGNPTRDPEMEFTVRTQRQAVDRKFADEELYWLSLGTAHVLAAAGVDQRTVRRLSLDLARYYKDERHQTYLNITRERRSLLDRATALFLMVSLVDLKTPRVRQCQLTLTAPDADVFRLAPPAAAF